jgi:hypothetical protein
MLTGIFNDLSFSAIMYLFVTKGVPETMELLRTKYGIKIGSSTGYTKEIMAMLKVRETILLTVSISM